MKDCCWVIKVTYLDNGEVNFNEGFWKFEKCMASIKNKINPSDMKIVNDWTIIDLDEGIQYEATLVDIF